MPEDIDEPVFPKSFLWGASVAGHQVEGGNHNQWTVWELENAAQLAKTAHKRLGKLKTWQEIKKQAEDPDNYVSGKGVDHFNRYEEDFDLAKKVNLKAIRFSIEWSRLEPEEGQWNQTAVDHYKKYIQEMKKRDLEPVLNIWHWTTPVWFSARGGFKYRRNIKYFERFVAKISEEYGHGLKYIITLNEPNTYAMYSYLTPEQFSGLSWPPQEKNMVSFARVYFNLVSAHKRAYGILKAAHPQLQIGIAPSLANIQAKNPHSFWDELSTKFMRYGWNWWFMHRLRYYQDFVGFNYYLTDYYTGMLKRQNPTVPTNDLGWYMEPEGIYPLLLRAWAHYQKPILISENGVADMHDQYRGWWLEETIVAMERARSEGVKIIGYFHWSLIDNFEWSFGWWPKFGLIAVDREHGMKRTIRPSAQWLAEKIEKLSK